MHLFIGFIRFLFLRFFFDYLPSDYSPLDEDQRQSQIEEAQAQEKEEDLTANIAPSTPTGQVLVLATHFYIYIASICIAK